ncbi:hypothetical protein TI05_13940 [Achromatium sp. WMS3]|nr:hypothetical protein TI05_13940 [Achromatium sp. WMS3]
MKQVASLRYGVIFKKAFSDPEVFKGFVRDFLAINLEIERVETEKSFSEPVGKVASRYDLFAEDTKNRVIVDIQHVRHPDHYNRFLHYHCAAILEQAASFNEYTPPLTVFTLVVLTSGDKHQQDISVIDFDPKTLAGEPLHEIAHKVFYICPKYLNETTPQPFQEWMRAIDDSLDGQIDEATYTRSEILKIFQLIEKDTISPEDRARMLDERREEAYGVTKYQEGKAEEARRTAHAMLKEGIDIELVCKITGLAKDDIM